MPKIVLVETVSMFRHLYAIELDDNEPDDHALDSVSHLTTGGDSNLEEFAQKHVSEDIFSHRLITEEEYLELFNRENDYIRNWPDEHKKRFIFKEA